MNIVQKQQDLLKKRYLETLKSIRLKRKHWDPDTHAALTELIISDSLKPERIDEIPERFIDSWGKFGGKEVFKPIDPENSNSQDIAEEVPKSAKREAIKAFNDFNSLFGENGKCSDSDILSSSVKECDKNIEGLKGKKYAGFVTKDGKVFRWVL